MLQVRARNASPGQTPLLKLQPQRVRLRKEAQPFEPRGGAQLAAWPTYLRRECWAQGTWLQLPDPALSWPIEVAGDKFPCAALERRLAVTNGVIDLLAAEEEYFPDNSLEATERFSAGHPVAFRRRLTTTDEEVDLSAAEEDYFPEGTTWQRPLPKRPTGACEGLGTRHPDDLYLSGHDAGGGTTAQKCGALQSKELAAERGKDRAGRVDHQGRPANDGRRRPQRRQGHSGREELRAHEVAN